MYRMHDHGLDVPAPRLRSRGGAYVTCIVGYKTPDGSIYIGGDSVGSDGNIVVSRSDAKVFENGRFLFGYTSSFRMGQLLRYKLNPPVQMPGSDTMRYMVTELVDAIRTCFRDGGYQKKDHDQEEGGTFLVGYDGELYTIESDYQVGLTHHPYMAVGAGREFAMGAMHALLSGPNSKTLPTDIITAALDAASEHNQYVRRPYVILEQKPPTK